MFSGDFLHNMIYHEASQKISFPTLSSNKFFSIIFFSSFPHPYKDTTYLLLHHLLQDMIMPTDLNITYVASLLEVWGVDKYGSERIGSGWTRGIATCKWRDMNRHVAATFGTVMFCTQCNRCRKAMGLLIRQQHTKINFDDRKTVLERLLYHQFRFIIVGGMWTWIWIIT